MSRSLERRLLEQRANIWEGMKALMDAADAESRDFTGEEESEWQTRTAELERLDGRIKDIRDAEARTADAEAALSDIAKRERRDDGGTTDADELRAYLRGERGRVMDFKAQRPIRWDEFRTLSKLTAGAGGNTVRTGFYERLMEHLIEVSGVLSANPTVLQTTSGEQIQVPKTTAHSSASLVAEAGTIGASDPTFGQTPLDAYKYAFLMQVSNELLTDTSVDLEGYLARQAGRALGNALGTALVTGTGSSQPNGVVTASTLGVTGATSVSGAFDAERLIDLFYSVIAPYRNSSSCNWMMRDATVAAVRKLREGSGTGAFLWQPSLQVGVPDTLLGKPIVVDPNVAAVALNAKSVLFGDFSTYFVRLVNGVRFERSDDYAFNTDLVTYRAIIRGDGDLMDLTGSIKHFVGGAS